MPYIGRPLNAGNLAVQSGTGDGSDTTPIATLDYSVGSSNSIGVYLDGVRQLAGTDFTASGTVLTFTTAPANLVGIDVYFLGLELSIPTPGDDTVTGAKIVDNAINSEHYTDGSIDTAHIAVNQIDETLMKDALVADFTEVVVTASDSILLGDATDSGNTKRDTVQGILDLAGGAFENSFLHVADHQSTSTNGGTFTAGAERTRVLNTVLTNEIAGASLGSNQITLPSGTYYIEAIAPAYAVNAHRTKVRDTTGSADLLIGISAYSSSSGAGFVAGLVSGRFTLSTESVIEIQSRCASTKTSNGFGVYTGVGPNEVYSSAKIWKVS
jgi:hypothetical protein